MSFIRILRPDGLLPGTDPQQLVFSPEQVQAWQDAQQLLAQARQEAERIRAEAVQAYEDEKQRGYEEGVAMARMDEAERLIENATRTVDYFAGIEQKIVALVMNAVRRIMADFDDTTRVLAVVQSGLSVMRNQKQLTLRLSPEHAATVRERAQHLLERFPGVGMMDIVPDNRLKGDAAILESEMGVVEASVELQLKAIEQGFTKLLGSRI
ncbi:MAG: HrpE/YscL family type III secretion apparatus protein [Betaproteobacteria bacterium]|jgi:type III secretion protein L